MRNATTLALLVAALGCGSDDSTAPDVTDGHAEDAAEALPDDGAADESGVEADVLRDDAAETPADVPLEDAPGEESGGSCGPTWHPTSCGDCSGGSGGDTCYQDCAGAACGDGHDYRAECNGTTGVCRCLIDGVEACACTSTNPIDVMGCEPEEWGGANCCWNVG